MSSDGAPPEKIALGSRAYRRLRLAMLLAGLVTFALLYCTQPLLPEFARSFHLSAAEASLAVSATAGSMALALLVAGFLSDGLGRRPVMTASLFAVSLATIVSAVVPDWHMLVAMRLVVGIALSGIPAVAMAYIVEEVEDAAASRAIGVYIAGSAIGGMSGRLLGGLLAEWLGWHGALGVTGGVALLCAIVFYRILPPSRHFTPRWQDGAAIAASLRRIAADRAMPWLFVEAFLLLGTFITIYNYLGFRLMQPPYALSQGQVAAMFLLYLAGSWSSAWFGGLAGVHGPRRILWIPILCLLAGVALTLARPLPVIVLGVGVLTIGFFGAHAVASAWVGRRARADRAQASALCLCFYYLGGSIEGSLGGFVWTHGGWRGVVLFAGVAMVLALLIALRLSRVAPLPPETPLRPSEIPAG